MGRVSPSHTLRNVFIDTSNICLKNFKVLYFNPLGVNPTKWLNTVKQFVGCCRQIVWVCMTIFWGWRLKGSALPFLHVMEFRIIRLKDICFKRYYFHYFPQTITKRGYICILKAYIAFEWYWSLSILFEAITGFMAIWMLRVSTYF